MELSSSCKNETLEKLVLISDEDFVTADIYSEQLDFVYTVRNIKLKNLIKMLQNDKHIYLDCLEYFL